MEGYQRELKFTSLDNLAKQMDSETKMAIAALRSNPNTEDVQWAIKAFRAWNQKQTLFWHDIFRFVEAEVTGEFPKASI